MSRSVVHRARPSRKPAECAMITSGILVFRHPAPVSRNHVFTGQPTAHATRPVRLGEHAWPRSENPSRVVLALGVGESPVERLAVMRFPLRGADHTAIGRVPLRAGR